MEWGAFQGWLLTGALIGLCIILWDTKKSLEMKHEEQGRDLSETIGKLSEKVQDVHRMMSTDLRLMDVRIARIEAHIWPHQPRQ
jgi:hypothetical protein